MNWILEWLRERGSWQKLTVTSGLLMLLAFALSACSGGEALSLQVGDEAPAFELVSSEGNNVALSDYQGQPVLLYFHMALG